MDRDLESNLQAAAESATFKYVVFVSLSFPSGTVYVHNSLGTITWGGNDWLGVGGFGSIDTMEENIKLVDNPVSISLSSITPEIIDAIKTDDIYHRSADIYLGTLNEADELVGTPMNWVTGYMEYASLSVGAENGLAISIQTRASRLRTRNNKRYTIEDHQADYPGDVFFEFLWAIKELEVSWGGADVSIGAGGGGGLPPGERGLEGRRQRN